MCVCVYVRFCFSKIVLGCTQIRIPHTQKTHHVCRVDIIKTRCARQITIFKRKKCMHVQRIDAAKNATSASPISNRCTEEIFNQLGWVFSPILFALFIAIASTPASECIDACNDVNAVKIYTTHIMPLRVGLCYVMCYMAKKRRKKQGNANMFLSLFFVLF